MKFQRTRVAATAAALVLAAAACGSDDESATTTTQPDAPPAALDLAAGTVEVLAAFDGAAGQQTEGVAVAPNGDVFVSWSFQGQIMRVPAGGDAAEPFGTVELGEGDFGVLGLSVDESGNVLAAVQSATASNGAWRFDAGTGEATQLPGTNAIGFPNDTAIDDDGNVYITSSTEGMDDAGAHIGAIWRVAPDGEAEQWLIGTDLGGTAEGGLPVPVGANGVEFHDGSLYVTNTEKGQVLVIDIAEDGSAGETSVLAQAPELGGADGLAVDDAGNVFVAVIAQSTIVRVDADGTVTPVAGDEDGLDYPSSVEIGAGPTAGSLLVVNFAVGELLGATTVEGPGLLLIPAAG